MGKERGFPKERGLGLRINCHPQFAPMFWEENVDGDERGI